VGVEPANEPVNSVLAARGEADSCENTLTSSRWSRPGLIRPASAEYEFEQRYEGRRRILAIDGAAGVYPVTLVKFIGPASCVIERLKSLFSRRPSPDRASLLVVGSAMSW